MSIARHNGLMQVCCDACPASFPETYAVEDFDAMISDARAAGWNIRLAEPTKRDRNTADLFGSPPRLANVKPGERFAHTCPTCLKPPAGGLL